MPVPPSNIKVEPSNDGQGVMLIQDGWPMFFVSDEVMPYLISALKSRRRQVIRRERIERGKKNAE